ncbi:Sugar transporter STL1 [Lachnellula suecica]|uniref:Sugar transporter STL1 n=1 Tax=Lachnellula suecica TaxID=602035 RepID=A0A8T9CIQ8_9HELO|nr:Sugar transporter STL1 [Lachnellula suecica]
MKSWFGRGRPLQIAVSGCCLLTFTLFGYDQLSSWLLQYVLLSLDVASTRCLPRCSLFTVNFWIGGTLGRRKVIWLAASIIIIGATLQCTAFSVAHLVVGRIITGMGTGLETSTVPMYQSELCQAHMRGRLVSAEVLFVGVGISLAYWFDFGMSFAGGSIAWRLPIAFQTVFAMTAIVLVFGLPESPRWLYNHNRAEEAREVLCTIYDRPADDPLIQHETKQIVEAIELEERNGRFKWRNIFKRDAVQTGRRVLLAWGVQFMNQIGGINLVVYYITSVLEENVGLSHQLALILGGCINMMFMFGALVPSFFLDQSMHILDFEYSQALELPPNTPLRQILTYERTVGRRKTMFYGCFGLGLSMMLISILLSFQGTSVEKPTASAAVAFFFTYMLVFGGTVNCVPWVYVPEILPLEARAKGTAVGVSSNWLWNFTIVMITPIIIERLKWKAYLIFMATNFAFIPIFYFFYPETSNKSLEDIDFLFLGGTSGLPRLPWSKRTTTSSSHIEHEAANENGVDKSGTESPVTEHVEKS